MDIFTEKLTLKTHLSKLKAQNKTIGFIPTMGALHKGHLSLIKKAQKKNDIVVVSIFVNPTQFNKVEDLINYPKTLENDIQLLQSVACNVLFHPSVKEVYGKNTVSEKFNFDGLEHEMEGKYREGHFDGVGTVVKTLFEIVNPDTAYFGQKDFQQLQIIKKMVKQNRLPLKVKGCKIFREKNGLAMSSRNARLSKEHRAAATFIYKTLKKTKKQFHTKSVNEICDWVTNQFKNHPLLQLEYFTIADEKTLKTIEIKESDKKYRAFIAVFAGEIRLIDNIPLR